MIEFAGLVAYSATVWMALTLYDYCRHRSRVDAWQERANRIRAMRGTP